MNNPERLHLMYMLTWSKFLLKGRQAFGMLFQQFGQEGFDLPAFGTRDLFGTLLDGLFGNLFGFAASASCCFLDRSLFRLGGASRTLVLFVVQRRQRVQRFATCFLALADNRRGSSERGIRRGHDDGDDDMVSS